MAYSGPSGRRRPRKNSFTTRSGATIRINQSLGERLRARRDDRQRRKAARLATLPKGRFKRLLFRLSPQRMASYWFSRDGAIMALKVLGIGIVVMFVLLVGLFAYFRKDLPKINSISGNNLGGSITYYDRTGKVVLWQDYNAVKRVTVPSNQISPYLKEATVAIEDKNFYHEGAFSISGIIRAGLHDVLGAGTSLQGASTITMQVVKLNENWIGQRTIMTKIKEVILAVDLSREYTKDQILTAYLNIAPYGGVDYGCQVAAQDYFNENCSQLTLAQSAMLAAIPQAPGYYSPFSDPKYNSQATINYFGQSAMLARQQYILDQMAQQHYITQAQADQAKQVDIMSEIHPLTNKYSGIQDPYFVLAAKQQLDNKYGAATVNRGGWKVITTLNTTLQNYAVQDVANNAANVARELGDEEGLVAEDVKTGQVVAEVGGENFNNPNYGQINYVNTPMSPGSSMKPFMYAALIQNNNNVGAGSVLYDTQEPLPGYPCTNKTPPSATSNGGNCLWDDNFQYPGPETIRYALGASRNVPAVKASYLVDPNDNGSDGYVKSVNMWINTANQAIGYPNAYACYKPGVNVATATAADMTQCYGSAAIGSGDIALDQEVNGDATLARMGTEIPQTYILSITNAAGKQIYKWQQPKGTQVYKPDTAYIINNMLSDPRATYLYPYQKFQHWNGWDIAVKTGTENQSYSGVMTAWTTQYAVIGFAGYHTLNQPLRLGQFENITEPLTRTWMEQALTNLHIKPVNWVQPPDIKVLPAFVETKSTGYGQEVPSPSTDLYPSWYTGPALNGGKATAQTIDRVSGNLATSCTPPLAQVKQSYSNANIFSIDKFWPIGQSTSNFATTTTATDNVHSCNDPPLVAPSIVVDDSATGNPQLDSSGNSTCQSTCEVVVSLSSPPPDLTEGSNPYPRYPITVNLLVNGQVVSTQTISSSASYGPTLTFNNVQPTATPAPWSVQIIDHAYYSATSNTITVVQASASSPGPTPSSTTGGNGNGTTGGNGNTPGG